MYEEDDLLQLSALQHLIFCERRAALVHIEQMWRENIFTIEGQFLHERADSEGTELRGTTIISRGLKLRSLKLGLVGKADVVEFHRSEVPGCGARLEGYEGNWISVPIEYKRGKLRHEEGYEIQICAQAMCLEEMLGAIIDRGVIYFGKTKRRLEISIDKALRDKTELASFKLHQLIDSQVTPPAHYSDKCKGCSMIDKCMPRTANGSKKVATYMANILKDLEKEEVVKG